MGALYGKAHVLDDLPAFKVRPAARPVRDRDARRSNRSRARSPPRTTCATSAARTATWPAAPGAGDASERRRELVAAMVAIADYERALVTQAHRRARADPGRDDPRDHRPGRGSRPSASRPSRSRSTASTRTRRRPTLGRQGIYVWDGDFYATGLIEALGQGRDRRRPADRARPLQHRRRGRPRPGGRRGDRRRRAMTATAVDPGAAGPRVRPGRAASDQAAVGPPLDRRGPPRHRRADRHARARLRLRDRRHRPALGGPRRRAGVLHRAVRGVPGQRVRAQRDRRRAAGRVRGRDADRHEPGPWAGAPPSGLAVSLEVLIFFPWDPATERFLGERIWFDRGAAGAGRLTIAGLRGSAAHRHHRGEPADDPPAAPGELPPMTRTSRAAMTAAFLLSASALVAACGGAAATTTPGAPTPNPAARRPPAERRPPPRPRAPSRRSARSRPSTSASWPAGSRTTIRTRPRSRSAARRRTRRPW